MWDLTLPGYKYLGPGNKLNKGLPTNYDDWVAYIHDIGYGKIIEQGGNPYLLWSEADAEAFRQFSLRSYGGVIGKSFFGLKKLSHDLGLIGKWLPESKKHDTAEMVRRNGLPKRLRGSDFETPIERKRKAENDLITPDKNKKARRSLNKRFRELEVTSDGDIINHSDESLENLPARTQVQMSSEGGSGNEHGLKETPVDDPYVVYRGPPDYTFCSLPWKYDALTSFSNYYAVDYTLRMTSPYDCFVSQSTSDLNASTGSTNVMTTVSDGSDASPQTARWFSYYAGMYNYYHVISCKYHVFIENDHGEPIWAYLIFHNDTSPPNAATNQDIQCWPDVKYHYLSAPYKAIQSSGRAERNDMDIAENNEAATAQADSDTFETGNHVTSRSGETTCSFVGEYKPGQFKREIRLDSEVENWTSTAANPALTERMTIRIKPQADAIGLNDTTNYGDDMRFRIRFSLNYLVEFKELKDGLRWPVQRQPISVTINNSVTSLS